MFSSLRSRLWLTYAILVGVVVFIVIGALTIYVARSNLLARFELTTVANRIVDRPNLPAFQRDQLDAIVARFDENLGMRVLVLNAQGAILADSRADTEGSLPHIPPPSDNGEPGRVASVTDENGDQWMYVIRRVQGNLTVVVATLRQPLREVVASPVIRELAVDILWAGGIALVFALVMAYVISRWVAAPLQNMSTAAIAVAEGQRTQVELAGPDEVRLLGEAFNEMTHRVHASQESQREFVANVSHELKTPLTSIQGFAQAILDGTASSPDARNQAAPRVSSCLGVHCRVA